MTYDETVARIRANQLTLLGQRAMNDHQSVEPIVRRAGHDVRSALSGIVGYAGLIEQAASDDTTRERASRIGQASEMLTRTADSMVEEVRNRTNDESLIKVTASEVVADALTGLDTESLGVRIPVDDRTDEPIPLLVDSQRIQAIIIDLIVSLLPTPEIAIILEQRTPEQGDAGRFSCTISAAVVADPSPTPVADYLLLLDRASRRTESRAGRLSHAFDFTGR